MFQKKKSDEKSKANFPSFRHRTRYTTTVAKSRGGKSEKQREAPRERKKVFSLVSFPFFSFFFFFFVVGKSFLEQREKTFSALEKKIWCWRLW